MHKFFTFLGIAMLSVFALRAQNIRGTVYDKASGTGIPGASILIKERPGTVATADADGKFALVLYSGETLVVKMIGYNPFQKHYPKVHEGQQIDIRLEAGVVLDEVMVTASLANSRSKRAIGTNVDHINAADIVAKSNPSSLADLLNGRISGAQVYNTNGKVGMPIRFDIRSAATFSMERDPLIFIDGVRYNNNNTADVNSSQEAMSALNDLPMNDIASIDVIKGPAAAASYGAEAANGVVIIQTKRGLSGQKGISINAKYTGGFSELANKYDQYVNNSALNDFFIRGAQNQFYANLSAQLDQSNSLFFSANSNKTSGTIPGNQDNRQTFRAGYDLTKGRFKLAFTAGYVKGKLSIPQSASGRDDAIWNLMRDQTPWPFLTEETWRAIEKSYTNDRLTGSLKLNYTFPFAIKMESLVGLDLNYIDGLNYLPYGYLQGTNSTGAKQISDRRNQNMNWDVKLSRSFALDPKWKLDLSLLSQLTQATERVNGISVRNFAVPGISNISSAAEILGTTDTDFEKRTHGIYGEAFLSYNNQLFINTGLRRDVSNMIGRNVASIWYPTVSVAYNLKPFDFLQGKIDEWKIRAAYGESGRLPYPNDAQTAYLVENSSFCTLVRPLRKGNPDIKPERTGEFEIGTDLSFAKQRLSFTYYQQNTRDAIVYTTLLPSLGWPSNLSGDYPENVGKIRGKGIEVTYNSRIFTSSNQKNSLDLFVIFNNQSNKVINSGGRDIINTVNLIREGLPAFSFYTGVSEGAVFSSSGIYTGAKESAPQVLGKPFPTYNGSFGFNLQLISNLRVQSLFTYSQGAKVYNISNRNVASQGTNFKASEDLKALLATQTPGAADYIATANELSKYAGPRGNFIEKADFIRLSNLTISYDLGSWAKKQTNGVLKNCTVSLTGNNLWLTTNYGGIEPQIDSQGGSKRSRGISYLSSDWTAVPAPRTYAFSLNIGF
ncbi:TonB-dependent receptor domain-containing protein [Pedobacter sp. MC2016-24]|uniref:TonB-dependent receptor domain-containing protein n=1 Tax=Pedobacter sp. MC2016-24 TaxID=2780090 RepID=UPI0018828945|nr:TonB-dependent receptor [Pedobacter sp. MC2016-24]MBE9601684.1 TonB-dependent receptor [Pedobacter sp. MC2016-24]